MDQSITQLSKVFLSDAGFTSLQAELDNPSNTSKSIYDHYMTSPKWQNYIHFNHLPHIGIRQSWDPQELSETLKKAKRYQVTEGARPVKAIGLGSIARIEIESIETDEVEYLTVEIVGYQEGNPDLNQVSYDSTLGKQLMGLYEGQVTEAYFPQGEMVLEVMELYKTKP